MWKKLQATQLPVELIQGRFNNLNHRERQVLMLLVGEELGCKAIGEKLNLSYRTVQLYSGNINQKLGTNNDFAITKLAIISGVYNPWRDEWTFAEQNVERKTSTEEGNE